MLREAVQLSDVPSSVENSDLGGNCLYNRVSHLASNDRAIGLHDDAVLLTILDDLLLLAQRVELHLPLDQNAGQDAENFTTHLDLIDSRQLVAGSFDFFDVMDTTTSSGMIHKEVQFQRDRTTRTSWKHQRS